MRKALRTLVMLALVALSLLAAIVGVVVLSLIELAHERIEFSPSFLAAACAAPFARSLQRAPSSTTVLLVLLARLLRVETTVKVGSYEIARGVTPLELLRKLTQGDMTQAEIAFIDGRTFRQLREQLDSHPDLCSMTHQWHAQSRAYALRRCAAGGGRRSFFSDTYLFAKHSSDVDLLARAARDAVKSGA